MAIIYLEKQKPQIMTKRNHLCLYESIKSNFTAQDREASHSHERYQWVAMTYSTMMQMIIIQEQWICAAFHSSFIRE